jgi:asparagine synthase (glutamine-hydrolysing)
MTMCGIAGWIDFENNLRDKTRIIEGMTDTLKLRGPDSVGYYISENVLFGHRRLIVVDPEGGCQPMIKAVDGNDYTIIYNGELYNTEDLRKELQDRGFVFDAYSDTEVLLSAYICWGAGCIHRLNGIFAFAVFDKSRREVFLARDPLGVKPLFYAVRGTSLVFGSELKTLFAHPLVKPVIDADGLTELFALGPASPPGSGTYKGIKEIPPAHYLLVSPSSMILHEYWKPEVEDFNETPEQAAEHLRALFVDAVKRQLVGDVPLCTFLSGGLDSSAISAVAAEEFRKQGRQLETYSIDYEDNDKFFKESLFQPTSDQAWALKMAETIKSTHHTVILGHGELARKLEQAVCAKDLPGMADIDSSLFLFCKEIRKKYVIALSGECADEIFGGYPWYTHPEMIYADTFPWSRFVADRKAILSKNLSSLKIDECVNEHYLDTLRKVPHAENEPRLDYRMRELFYLNIKWFMINLLNRKDRMSMSNSLEVRVPFADYRLVQYAFNLPPAVKLADGREKGLLRRAFAGLLPDEIVTRKKSPYPKTHNPVYTEIVCSMMNDILDNKNSPLLELIDRTKIREIVDSRGASYKTPWFGQLMTGPQLIAYLIQVNIWLVDYHVELEI